MNTILTPTSPGELIDKLTILRIKSEQISDEAKLANIRQEQDVLAKVAQEAIPDSSELRSLWDELYAINCKLWVIEDDIRACEANKDFGPTFIELARAVYFTNDLRAVVKKKINLLLGSDLVEEKSYHSTEAS